MAQLTDDCFAFNGPLMPIEDAHRLMAAQIPPVAESESVPLAEAFGRVAAQDIKAPIALPSFENSAVDGYAVRHGDIGASGDTQFRIVERVFAGDRPARALASGEAARIFTGAPMPAGADTVYMQEDCRQERDEQGDFVIVPPGLRIGANRRLPGEDVKEGAVAIPEGRRLKPQDVALAAALGIERITVRRRVKVALFSTGNEIVEPGKKLPPAALYDANRFLLLGLLRVLGVEVSDLGILSDDAKSLETKIAEAARSHDLVLTSGGVSTGDADYVKSAVEKIGKLVLWRIAIKPGRPVAMGVISGAAFAGLPGNPAAVFVTFAHIVRPLLLRLMGADIEPLTALPVRAAFDYRKKKDRREYVRVALKRAPDGVFEAHKHPQEGAGVITSLTETDGFAELLETATTVKTGEMIGFISYAALAV
ncbi:MAG TPA: gephyrin-like molybdotransferase Glp [Xanthobacteraceae bacterium]|nr:gephyrin-like molybdotransferase Glp [Xanthobacteraceae bacterium]